MPMDVRKPVPAGVVAARAVLAVECEGVKPLSER